MKFFDGVYRKTKVKKSVCKRQQKNTKNHNNKQIFVRLLECADPDLFNWLMNHGRPEDDELFRMVKLIQEKNKNRGPVEI